MSALLRFDPREVDGVNYDLDNCLIVSDAPPGSSLPGLHAQSWLGAAQELLRRDLTGDWADIWAEVQGYPEPEAVRRLGEALEASTGTRLSVPELVRARAEFLGRSKPEVQINPGVLDVLTWYRDKRVPQNIVTSSGSLFVRWVLSSTPLGEFFDPSLCITADVDEIVTSRRWKPDAHPWELGRSRLELREDARLLRLDDTATCLISALQGSNTFGYLPAADEELRAKAQEDLRKALLGPERACAAHGWSILRDALLQ